MDENKKLGSGSFVKQAGVLAIAGIIVKIISLIYRSPLTSIIGLEGNGYYSAAINVYTIILLIASYSIPSAISKVISTKLALKEYKNAYRVFICALIYVIVVGGIASLVAFFGAGSFVESNSVPVLRVFAPTIFLSGILGVLRGVFQGHGTMLPTSLSQILEQIVNAAVSIGAAYLLIQSVSDKDATTRAIYGASGSAIGTGMGVLSALILMFVLYRYKRKRVSGKLVNHGNSHEDSYADTFKLIFTIVTPFILSTFIYNCSTVVNMKIFYHILMDVKGWDETKTAIEYGIFATQAISVVNIPIALSSAMSSATIPAIATSYALGDIKDAKHKVLQAVRATMLIAIPAAAGFIALSKPIMSFIYPQKEALDKASSLLMCLGITVVLYCLSTLTNAILQAIGKVNVPVINAVIALGLQVLILWLLLYFTNINIYGLAVANIVYSLAMCVLNQMAVRKYMGYRQEIKNTFVKPVIASIIMGGICRLICFGLEQFINVNRIPATISICVGGCLYFVLIIKMGAVSRTQIRAFPRGYTLEHIADTLHLFPSHRAKKAKVKRAK